MYFFEKVDAQKLDAQKLGAKLDARARLTSNQNTCIYAFILNTVYSTTIYGTVKRKVL